MVLEKTLESPLRVLERVLESLNCKEIKPVSPKGNRSLGESLRVWSARRSNQSVLKEISAENSLEGLMLKLNLQYFGLWCEALTHWKRLWCWERLKAEGEEDDRGWDSLMASLTWWTWVWPSSRSRWWTGKPGMLQSLGSQRVRHDWMTELNQNDWGLRLKTETKDLILKD